MGIATSRFGAPDRMLLPGSPNSSKYVTVTKYPADAGDGRDQTDEELDGQQAVDEVWREVLERLLARPTSREFPWLSPAQETALKFRGRHKRKKGNAGLSTLPAHHDHARRELRNNMRTLSGKLRMWSQHIVFLVNYHKERQTHTENVNCFRVQNLSQRWLSSDKTCQGLLQKADEERARCFEFLGRPGVARALSPENLWAGFPGCRPNRVQTVKRRRLHYRKLQYQDLYQIELEMEGAAALAKTGAKDLYAAQCAFYTAISQAKPDFWFVESPPPCVVTYMPRAEWGDRQHKLLTMRLGPVLGRNRLVDPDVTVGSG